MNIQEFTSSVGKVMYDKGLIGHVTVDLVTFPNPQDPDGHPLFWAVDISAHITDNASACLFFDILMEGELDPMTGEYEIESTDNTFDEPDKRGGGENDFAAVRKEPRNFMFCNYLHHPGLASI